MLSKESLLGRFSKEIAIASFVRQQGPEWVAFRLQYELQRRLRVHERKSPIREWSRRSPEPVPEMTSVVDQESLQSWLSTVPDQRERDEIIARARSAAEMTFSIFGDTFELASWLDDPYAGVSYPPADSHWSAVKEIPGADLKCVWEPSRFGWAFDVARAHLLEPDAGHDETFWVMFDSWRDQNAPNSGVNWNCGQESSIRLIAVTCAAQAMSATITPERAGLLHDFALATGERVNANISYAKSQRNNHYTSEAAGLITAALYVDHDQREHFLSAGIGHLVDACESLILEDGGSSQYSTNYHRVFMQGIAWAVLCLRAMNEEVPAEVTSALRRGVELLATLQLPTADEGCFFGPDDGARILPLSASAHRDLRDDLALLGAISNVRVPSAGIEPLAWFGLSSDYQAATNGPTSTSVQHFPKMGIAVLRNGHSMAVVRCGVPDFRLHEDDMLHVSAWLDGQPTILDPGTQSYTPREGDPGPLASASAHNSPRFDGLENSERVGRFLLARPPEGTVQSLTAVANEAVGEFFLRNYRGQGVTRRVVLSEDSIEISDRQSDPTVRLESTWIVDEDAVLEAERAEETKHPVSHGYGTFEMHRAIATTNSPVKVRRK